MNQNDLAHSIWKEHLLSKKGEKLNIIDATCGNGYDSLFLSEFEDCELHCIDIQEKALITTKKRLENKKNTIHYYLKSHEDLSFIQKPIDLIVYNLGYLPGSDKKIITNEKTTLASLSSAKNLLKPSGMISVMVYTGHIGGDIEKISIMNFISNLNKNFKISHFNNPLKVLCPELIIIKKLI